MNGTHVIISERCSGGNYATNYAPSEKSPTKRTPVTRIWAIIRDGKWIDSALSLNTAKRRCRAAEWTFTVERSTLRAYKS